MNNDYLDNNKVTSDYCLFNFVNVPLNNIKISILLNRKYDNYKSICIVYSVEGNIFTRMKNKENKWIIMKEGQDEEDTENHGSIIMILFKRNS